MDQIDVAVSAYILTLYPALTRNGAAPKAGNSLKALSLGLAAPSFWSREGINKAFTEANRIWMREAKIRFSPVNVTERDEVVPADEDGMWIRFLNTLSPKGRGIGVGFVYDLPAAEGGWGGGRIAVISGEKASAGIPSFAGNLLAHELGHVLIEDHDHKHAGNDSSNLMHGNRHPRVANAGLLNAEQVELARARAATV